jgi:hypothetical protein
MSNFSAKMDLLLRRRKYGKIQDSIELSVIANEGQTHAVTSQSWFHRNMKSWRFTILTGAVLTFLVLTINITIAVVVHNVSHADENGTGRTLFTGDCEKVKIMNTWAHFAINLMSTLMLSASNFAMQCLSAPTRTEVDRGHSKNYWLDIGVLSFRNLRIINKKRVVLLALLGMSSLPLHML